MKKIAIAIGAVVIAAGVLYRFSGLRVKPDGSGIWPRFVSTGPDYDALDADRARQRGRPAAVPDTPTSTVAIPEPVSPQPAQVVDEPTPTERAPLSNRDVRHESWSDFRGPNRDGRYDVRPIRTDWPDEGLPLLWKQPVGPGYASFVAAGGTAYTIEQRCGQEVAAAYDIETGRELWTHAWDGEFVESMGGDGPRATPTYHDGRVYTLGALGEFRCLDARSGAQIWRRNILADAGATNLYWGMSAAPLVVDDVVIVVPGGPGGKSVAAYDRVSGGLLWTALDDQAAYSSPMLVTLGGVRQLLVLTATRAVGLSSDGGGLLWEYPWVTENGINVAQPLLLGDDRVFLSAGYGHGAAAFKVERTGRNFTTRAVWQTARMKNKFTSSVLHQGYIYGLDEAILTCIDAATGDVKWKNGRYGYGQVLLAGDRLIVLTEDGQLVQVRATPDGHDELARFQAIEGKTWNHPIIVDGRLLVRNVREMAAYDVSIPR